MIFVDTGAFVARYIQRDRYHKQAVLLWTELAKRRERCITSNFVLDEAFTLLGRLAGNRFAAARAGAIYASRLLKIVRPEEDVETEAIEYLIKFADQQVSFTDCTSFVLMKRERIRRAFTFDADFQRAGFSVLP